MRFELANPLSEAQWKSVEKAALQILEKTGMAVRHGEALRALSGISGVRVDGENVRFDPKLVKEQSRSVKGTNEYDTHLITGAYCHNYLDPATGQARKATLADLISSARQANALNDGVCAPVVPLDVPGPKQELVMERVTHENCRFSYGGGQVTTVPAAEASIEMSAVVNRPHSLELWIADPLVVDSTGMEILWRLKHRRPKVRICNMPALGMSCPISISGLLAQTVAECLGAATVLKLLDLSDDISYRVDAFWGYSVDMRSGNVLLSGPDYLRLMTLSIFLAKRYGIDAPMAKALLTSSKLPDAQAAAEKSAQALLVSMAGTGTFTAAGALSAAETYSPIQMIVDKEILRWVDAYIRPVDFSEKDFLLERHPRSRSRRDVPRQKVHRRALPRRFLAAATLLGEPAFVVGGRRHAATPRQGARCARFPEAADRADRLERAAARTREDRKKVRRQALSVGDFAGEADHIVIGRRV